MPHAVNDPVSAIACRISSCRRSMSYADCERCGRDDSGCWQRFASVHPSSHVGRADLRAPCPQPLERASDRAGIALEQIEQDVRELLGRREQQAVVAVPHALGEAGAVVERQHRHAGAEQIGDLHRNVEARRRSVQAQPEVGAADHARIVFRLEPARAQLNAPRRQAGEPPFELGAAFAVAGHENDQVRKPPVSAGRPPSRECAARASRPRR